MSKTSTTSSRHLTLKAVLTTWYGEGTRLLDVPDARAPHQGLPQQTGASAENTSAAGRPRSDEVIPLNSTRPSWSRCAILTHAACVNLHDLGAPTPT